MTTLDTLLNQLSAREAEENPDQIVLARDLGMSPAGNIVTPNGEYAMTQWSRSQLASLLGVRWDRWFHQADPQDRANDVIRRLRRMHPATQIKLRTKKAVPDAVEADGTVMAFVSPSYTPVSNVVVGRLLEAALRGVSGDTEILRSYSTDRTTGFALAVGEPQTVGGTVGAVWGGISVVNSGVGYSALSITAFLYRLACSNGMVAPLPKAELVRRSHRGVQLEMLGARIFDGMAKLPGDLSRSLDVLENSTSIPVTDTETTVRQILKD